MLTVIHNYITSWIKNFEEFLIADEHTLIFFLRLSALKNPYELITNFFWIIPVD